MRSIKNESKQPKKSAYPCLKKFPDGTVVLFTALTTGVCVHKGETNFIGEFDREWAEDTAKLFVGTITLSNE